VEQAVGVDLGRRVEQPGRGVGQHVGRHVVARHAQPGPDRVGRICRDPLVGNRSRDGAEPRMGVGEATHPHGGGRLAGGDSGRRLQELLRSAIPTALRQPGVPELGRRPPRQLAGQERGMSARETLVGRRRGDQLQ